MKYKCIQKCNLFDSKIAMNEGDLIELNNNDKCYHNLTSGQVYYSQVQLNSLKSFLCNAEPEFKENTINSDLYKRNVTFTNDSLNKEVKQIVPETFKETLMTDSLVEYSTPDKFKEITEKLHDTYKRKNHDYGNSFEESLDEEGLAASRIRIGDKWNRYKTLSRGTQSRVSDESIRDTLLDMANYAIMTVMWLDKHNN